MDGMCMEKERPGGIKGFQGFLGEVESVFKVKRSHGRVL